MNKQRFWERRPLAELTQQEWELLCDGCGKCCLHKLENDADGLVYYTDVACRLLDTDSCRCTDYEHRKQQVSDCLQLTYSDLHQLDWLPSSCAYRLLAEGEALPDWHHLISGKTDSVHTAGVSVRGRCVAETDVDDLEDHIVFWPE